MDTLTAIDNRMDGLESKIGAFEDQMKELKGTVEDQVEELKGTIENKIQELNDSVENQVEQLSEKVDSSLTLSTTIKYRLQAWMSEVRLISLFKMADMNRPHAQYGTGGVTTDNSRCHVRFSQLCVPIVIVIPPQAHFQIMDQPRRTVQDP